MDNKKVERFFGTVCIYWYC